MPVCMCLKSSWAAITKYQDWVASITNLFFHSSGGWNPEIRVPAWLGCGEGSLPGLQTATLLYPHMAFPRCVHGVRERSLSPPLISLPVLSVKILPLSPHLALIIS